LNKMGAALLGLSEEPPSLQELQEAEQVMTDSITAIVRGAGLSAPPARAEQAVPSTRAEQALTAARAE
jgi:hypothetical protein